MEKEQTLLFKNNFFPDVPSYFTQPSWQETPPRNFYPWIVFLSAPASEGLNAGPEAKHPFQEMEFDSWVGSPTLVQGSILACIYISGVNVVTHPALRQTPCLLTALKFGRGHLLPLPPDSSHSGNGCQALPRVSQVGMLGDRATSGSRLHPHQRGWRG